MYIEVVPLRGAPTMKKLGLCMEISERSLRRLLRQLLADDARDRLQVLEGLHGEHLVAQQNVEALLDEADQLDEDDGVEAQTVLEERRRLVQGIVGQVDVQILDDDTFDLFQHFICHVRSLFRWRDSRNAPVPVSRSPCR